MYEATFDRFAKLRDNALQKTITEQERGEIEERLGWETRKGNEAKGNSTPSA